MAHAPGEIVQRTLGEQNCRHFEPWRPLRWCHYSCPVSTEFRQQEEAICPY